MASFKIIMNDKSGKSVQRELKDDETRPFFGKKIGETIKGELFGLAGYEFTITGGSDSAGFPMRADLKGTLRKRIFAVEGVGMKKHGHGQKQRKNVAGNTIFEKTAQINLTISKQGKEALFAAPAEDKADAKEGKQPGKEDKPSRQSREEKKETPDKPIAEAAEAK
ncbi:MAG: S6e family ribosomal protein [Nanoarchaeota archaeon]